MSMPDWSLVSKLGKYRCLGFKIGFLSRLNARLNKNAALCLIPLAEICMNFADTSRLGLSLLAQLKWVKEVGRTA